MDTKRKKFFEAAWLVLFPYRWFQMVGVIRSARVHVRSIWQEVIFIPVVFVITTCAVATAASTATTTLEWVSLGLVALGSWYVGAIIEPWRWSSVTLGREHLAITLVQGFLLGALVGILWVAIVAITILLI